MSLMLQMLRKLRSISTIIKWPSQDNLFGTATATTVHVHVYKTLKIFRTSKTIQNNVNDPVGENIVLFNQKIRTDSIFNFLIHIKIMVFSLTEPTFTDPLLGFNEPN